MIGFIRKVVVGIALLSVGGQACLAQELTKVKFSLDWLIQGPTAPYVLAQARGYFKQEGLDIDIDSGNGSTAFILRVGSGAYDFGIGDMTAYIEYLANNPGPSPMKAVYVIYNESPNVVYALKKGGIAKPADLAGKRVAGAAFAATRKLWPLFARATKMDPLNVNWMSVDPSLREPMLVRGAVDAVAGFTTDRPSYSALGVTDDELVTLKFSDYGIQLYGGSIFASTKMIEQKPQVVAAFLRAVAHGFRDALADRPAAIKAIKDRNSLIDEAQEKERLDSVLPLVVTAETKQYGMGSAQPGRLAKQVDDTVYAFDLKVKPSPTALFTPEFLPPLADRLPPGS